MGKSILSVIACVVLLASAVAQKSTPSTVETWKLDAQKSTMEHKPQSLVVKVTANSPTALRYTFREVDADGKPSHGAFNGAPDGRPYPITGGDTFTTIAYKWDNNVLHSTWTMKSGGNMTQDATVSEDGNTMTIQNRIGDQSWTEVYDKVIQTGQTKPSAKKSSDK